MLTLSPLPSGMEVYLKSLTSDHSTYITFKNKTSSQVSLKWVDFNGQLVLYKEIDPGEAHRQQTYVTHPWVACDRNSEPIAVFLPTNSESQAIIHNQNELSPLPSGMERYLKSLVSDHSTYVKFVNKTNVQVSINWVDFNGKLVLYKDLGPGDAYRQQTYVTHPWVACGRNSEPIAVFLPTNSESQAIIHNQNELSPLPSGMERYLKSLVSDHSTYVKFVNKTNVQVSVNWVDFNGKLVLYKDLGPEDVYRQQTYVTHPWVACAPNSEPIAVFLPTPDEAIANIHISKE